MSMKIGKIVDKFAQNKIEIDQSGDKYYVYALWQGNQIVYIGRSKRLYTRLEQHKADKEFDGFSYILLNNECEMEVLETFCISELRPKYNKNTEARFITVRKARQKMIKLYPQLRDIEELYTRPLTDTLIQNQIPVHFIPVHNGLVAYIDILSLPKLIDKALEIGGQQLPEVQNE